MAKDKKKKDVGALEETVNTPAPKKVSTSGGMSNALRKQVIRAHWHLVEDVIAKGAKMEDIMKLPNGTREMVRRAYA